MCFGMILQTQGNAGTAFLRRLAIQFSKTEPHPSIREPALEPSPDRRGVAKTAVLRQGRTALLPAPSRIVKRKVRNRVPSCLRDVRESISTSTRLAPSSLRGDPDRFTVPTRGALLLTPRGPRRQLPGKLRLLGQPRFVSQRRGRLLPAPRPVVKRIPSTFDFFRPGSPAARARLLPATPGAVNRPADVFLAGGRAGARPGPERRVLAGLRRSRDPP